MSGILNFLLAPPGDVQQKVSQLATSGMRRGLVGVGGGGVWFGCGKSLIDGYSGRSCLWPTHGIYFEFQDAPLIIVANICS